MKHAHEALAKLSSGHERQCIVQGIIRPSRLLLEYFDIVTGMDIDYMHGVLLGVHKLQLKLWFGDSYSKGKSTECLGQYLST